MHTPGIRTRGGKLKCRAACGPRFPRPLSHPSSSSRVTTALPTTAALPRPPPALPGQKATKSSEGSVWKGGRSFSLAGASATGRGITRALRSPRRRRHSGPWSADLEVPTAQAPSWNPAVTRGEYSFAFQRRAARHGPVRRTPVGASPWAVTGTPRCPSEEGTGHQPSGIAWRLLDVATRVPAVRQPQQHRDVPSRRCSTWPQKHRMS